MVFLGFEIPEIEELRRVTKEVAIKTAAEQGLYFVGWDMALTDEGKWIAIEGNGNAAVSFGQRLVGRGCKDYYREIVSPVIEELKKRE